MIVSNNRGIKKIELVSPAGGWEQLVAAINGGADAVYLGYKKYGARAYAENFEMPQLKKAVKTSHDNGLKVYLTLNTLIKDSELKEIALFLNEYLSFCRDGIIIQDPGLFKIIKDLFPDARVHASTQLNIHNLKSVQMLKELGFARAVLAREMSLEEIRHIREKEGDFELEVFAHGSQCYSYSGSCYFSSFTGSRSGNRGRCTQPCRMKYSLEVKDESIFSGSRNKNINDFDSNPKLIFENSYLLSKTDLAALELIPQIADAGVSALKIEGRMKTAEYVGIVTKIYRKYIDYYYANPDGYRVDGADIYKITQIFSRDLGKGYFFDSCPREIVSLKKSGSIGNFLGRINKIDFSGQYAEDFKKPVKKFDNDKKRSTGSYPEKIKNKKITSVYIKSGWPINKGDILELWTNKGNEQLRIGNFNIEGTQGGKNIYKIEINKQIRLNMGDRAFKLFDKNLDEEAKNLYINGITAKAKKTDQNFAAEKSRIISGLRSDGSVLYLKVDRSRIDDYFKSYEVICESTPPLKTRDRKTGKTVKYPAKNPDIALTAEVYDLKDIEPVWASGIRNIVINNFNELFSCFTGNIINKSSLSVSGSTNESGSSDCRRPVLSELEKLKKDLNNKNINLIIKTPGIIYDKYFNCLAETIGNLTDIGIRNFAVSNTGVLKLLSERHKDLNLYMDYSLNTFNSKTISFYDDFIKGRKSLSLKSVGLSAELSLEEIRKTLELYGFNGSDEIEFPVYSYGFYPVMSSRFKMVYLDKNYDNKNGIKKNYYLMDQKGYKFRIESEYNDNLVFLSSKKTCNLFDLSSFFTCGIRNFYIDTRTFKLPEIKKIIEVYKNALHAVSAGDITEYDKLMNKVSSDNLFSNYTRGHFFREVM